MMLEYVTIGLAALAFAAALAAWLRARAQAGTGVRILEAVQRQDAVLAGLRTELAQTRSELREEQARQRTEQSTVLGGFRAELGEHLKGLRTESGTAARTTREETLQSLDQYRGIMLDTLGQFRTALLTSLEQTGMTQAQRLADVTGRLDTLTASNEQRLETLRASVEGKLQEIRADNATRLEQMRVTVDEKLQSTLDQRLGESFKLVGEQLERVQSGLGEMQALATGVGDLKRVLSNVKTRGTWGEIQLSALLEQILTPEQYGENVAVKQGSQDRVEFAVRLPGRGDPGDAPVWLPIDAKFPQEDYVRLELAREAADLPAVDAAGKALEVSIRNCAKAICTKYLDPPRTTDIGIMFLPTESLYAEVARRPGLLECLQRDYRVLVAGPSTLAALLNSLQMGFRTLAIQQRSSEVWNVLGNVKTQFSKFEGLLAKVHRKLEEAASTVEETQKRTRILQGKMKDVEALPAAGGPALADGDELEDVLALASVTAPAAD